MTTAVYRSVTQNAFQQRQTVNEDRLEEIAICPASNIGVSGENGLL